METEFAVFVRGAVESSVAREYKSDKMRTQEDETRLSIFDKMIAEKDKEAVQNDRNTQARHLQLPS